MEFFVRNPRAPRRLGVFPGTFNPPTRAHLALARAALAETDEVLFVLPRIFPHKPYTGANFAERVQMLLRSIPADAPFSVAACDRGLFLDIAAECRELYGAGTALSFLCGRDAAERIVGWDYSRPGALADMFSGFELLVASRRGDYQPPAEFRHAIRPLQVPEDVDGISASGVRERVERGEPWRHLVPETIADRVRQIYTRRS